MTSGVVTTDILLGFQTRIMALKLSRILPEHIKVFSYLPDEERAADRDDPKVILPEGIDFPGVRIVAFPNRTVLQLERGTNLRDAWQHPIVVELNDTDFRDLGSHSTDDKSNRIVQGTREYYERMAERWGWRQRVIRQLVHKGGQLFKNVNDRYGVPEPWPYTGCGGECVVDIELSTGINTDERVIKQRHVWKSTVVFFVETLEPRDAEECVA